MKNLRIGRVRRTLAVALAAGTLLLAAGCADDDLASDDNASGGDDETSATEDGGLVSIAGQNFPEATLVASMYEQLLTDAGYEPTVNLVDSRDGYMPTFPGDVDVVPEYVGGIVNFLNAQANGADAEPFEAGDGGELADAGADLLDRRRHHPARHLAGDRHQRVLRDPGVLRGERRHQAVRPRGRLGHPGRGPRLRGPPRLRGRPDRASTAST